MPDGMICWLFSEMSDRFGLLKDLCGPVRAVLCLSLSSTPRGLLGYSEVPACMLRPMASSASAKKGWMAKSHRQSGGADAAHGVESREPFYSNASRESAAGVRP